MVENDGSSSNSIHFLTPETRASYRCPDSPSRNTEYGGKNAGSIGRINHAGVMTPSQDLRGKVLRTIRVAV